MGRPNEHVSAYLDDYIRTDTSPGFCVMLTGPWGSGKTWFIKHYIESHTTESRRFLYTSLFGLSSAASLYTHLFLATKPKLRSRGVQFTANLVNSALRTSGGKDVSHISSTVFGFFATRPGDIVVLDDLERCLLSSNQLLGIINDFIEHRRLHVIILTNEDILREKIKKEYCDGHRKLLEKVVGQTFSVTPDLLSALDSFLLKPRLKEIASLLDSCRQDIATIFIGSAHGNLRILDRALWGFHRLYSILPNDLRNNPELQRHLLTNYLIYTFAVVCDDIDPNNISSVPTARISAHLRLTTNSDNTETPDRELADILERHSELQPEIPLLETEDWALILRDGILRRDRIVTALRSSPYSPEEDLPAWVKLWHYIQLSDEQFARTRDIVLQELRNCELENIYVTVMVAGIFIVLVDKGLLEMTIEEIESHARTCIATLIRTEDKTVESLYSNKYEDWHGGYRGLGYVAMERPEMKRLLDYILEELDNLRQECLPSLAEETLALMSTDPEEFFRLIALRGESWGPLYNVPIFAHINPDGFTDELESIPPMNRQLVSSAYRTRYEHMHITPNLIEEEDNLALVISHIMAHAAASQALLTSFYLKEFAEKTLAPALEIIRTYRQKSQP